MENFKNWFNSAWIEAGGLITTSTAGLYLGISSERVTMIAKTKNWKKYRWQGDKRKNKPCLVSLRDVITYDNTRRKLNFTYIRTTGSPCPVASNTALIDEIQKASIS